MLDRKEIKLKAKESLKGNMGAAIVISIITLLLVTSPCIITETLGDESIIANIISAIVNVLTAFLSVGMTKFYMDVATKSKGELKTLFWGSHLYIKAFLINFVIGVAVTLGTILFIVPGIIIALMYSQAIYVMIDNPDMGVFKCLRKSKDIMKGHKWEFFGLQLSFICWFLLIPITLGLAYFYVVPYTNTTYVNYYLNLVDDYKINNGIADNMEADIIEE